MTRPPALALITVAVLALAVACPVAVLAGPSLTLSPPSGMYAATQSFDLALLIDAPGLLIVGAQAILDGANVTATLAGCLIPGTLLSGGQTFRCPRLAGSLFGSGVHILTIKLSLSDGSTVSRAVIWNILTASGP